MLIDFAEDDIPQCDIAIICGLFLKIVVHNFLRCSGRSMASDVGLEPPGSSAIRGGCKKADELCRRVLTTSRGHVTTAPTVPATPPATR